eukprot:TRINITY_DN9490_c0_g1_i8.p1 TRINITY_DN9490_c0_g1~~TRINITY_DN9490_c0_g1_i8.p1  ORF type:complete len:592 (-),score=94.94 TRINITY_DN9490_c0_g1_i8:1086-2861(-)
MSVTNVYQDDLQIQEAEGDQFSLFGPEVVIIVLKEKSALTKLRAICSESTQFFQAAQKRYGWSSSCHMPGQCIHVYEHVIQGVYGTFTQADMKQLTDICLKDEIDYYEIDTSVQKTEGQQEDLDSPPEIEEDENSYQLNEMDNNHPAWEQLNLLPDYEEYFDQEHDTIFIPVATQTSTPTAPTKSVSSKKFRESMFVWDGIDEMSEISKSAMSKMKQVGHYAAEYIDSKSWQPEDLYQASLKAQFEQLHPNDSQAVGYKIQNIPQAFWNLDRVDQIHLPLDGQYTYGGFNQSGTGKDVTIYIIDSGIRSSHQEFVDRNGKYVRAFAGADFVDADGEGEDCDGHGTHVASTAIGRAVGLAKEARAVGVRVLDCKGQGRVGNLIAGIDWVVDNIHGPSVATLSLGIMKGAGSRALNQAVKSMTNDYDVTTVVASGNLGMDSCDIVPANIPETITVAASDLSTKFTQTAQNDLETMYKWSNTGQCVDLFAPGVAIYAACGGVQRCDTVHDAAYTWADGTSMAVPHVAAAAAIFLGEVPDAKPADVRKVLIDIASVNKIDNDIMLPGTPNRLLYTNLATMMSYYQTTVKPIQTRD